MVGPASETGAAAAVAAPGRKPPAGLPVRTVRKFQCPHCGGEIEIRAGGHSLSAACAHCGSIIDVADERLRVIQAVDAALRPTLLEIGARGKLFDTVWEVIGYTQKSDRTRQYFWDEYLLFNPYQGFHFLVQQDGHWNYVKIIKDVVDKRHFAEDCAFRGELYKPFLKDNPIVQYVKGEFYWRVKKGDQAKTEDYICPPDMLSFEYADQDITLSLCRYVQPGDIQKAFGLGAVPARKGIGPNQPGPADFEPIVRCAAIAVFVLSAFLLVMLASAARQTVAHVNGVLMPGDRARVFMTDRIDIPKSSNILVTSRAPVDNAWAEAELSLVNDDTKAEIELRQAIEYYHGYDSDGAWSEGGTTERDYFSAVPPGRYHLMYGVDSDVLQKGGSLPFEMDVRRDVESWSNYLAALALLLAYPVLSYMSRQSFETKRWENSDFPRGGNN